VVTGDKVTSDACAICHRAHTATGSVPYRMPGSTDTTGSSLIASTEASGTDVPLCYSCHGIAQLGSAADVQSSFESSSVHVLAPATSPYGTSPKLCSSCHDSHGSARTASGTPYPALLRSFEGTAAVMTGEEYCAACHAARADERWDGLAVYRRTGHFTGIPTPASGTGIRCSICHASHGSGVAPLLVASIVPTAAPATTTVTADDRTFCIACHTGALASWPGTSTYAASAHAVSATQVSITAKWVPAGTRRVGECQVCHAPMGSSDGAGGVLPKLLDARGRVLCDRCHKPGGPASTDTSTQAYPSAESTAPELVAVYQPAVETSWSGRVSVYGRATFGAAPRALIGPREYRLSAHTGPSAAGDIDGDGAAEIVVADKYAPVVTVFSRDPLTGLGSHPATAQVPAGRPIRELAVANVLGLGWLDGPAEIVAITEDGYLVLYSWNGSTLATAAGPVDVGRNGPWGLATGNVTSTARPDVVVTNGDANRLYIIAENAGGGISSVVVTAGPSPSAPSVGEIDSGSAGNEIVVGNAGATTETLSVFSGAGVKLSGHALSAGGGVPTASAIGDLLPGYPGAELVMSFADETSGDSTVAVVPQSGSELDTVLRVLRKTGSNYNTGSLLIADVDADGANEMVVGNAGHWKLGEFAAPSLQVFRPDGSGRTLDLDVTTLLGGGVELAGAAAADAPSLAVADLGPVLPSRHPVDEVAPTAHVSTETASATRHVTCADCHDSHEATSSVPTAPAVQGLLAGAQGVAVVNDAGSVTYTGQPRSVTSYGVCFRCHSGYTTLGGRSDVALQFNSENPSVHAIEGPSLYSDVAAETFVSPSLVSPSLWNSKSVLYCSDCHDDAGRSGAQARGVHTSSAAPILAKAYLGRSPDDESTLCYGCHKFSLYAKVGAEAGAGSAFKTSVTPQHGLHVAAPANGGRGFGCGTCHVSHGSATQPYLLRDEVGFEKGVQSHTGSCTNACHTTSDKKHTYGP
jgi:predicted CXXCH cytochrome family protein